MNLTNDIGHGFKGMFAYNIVITGNIIVAYRYCWLFPWLQTLCIFEQPTEAELKTVKEFLKHGRLTAAYIFVSMQSEIYLSE